MKEGVYLATDPEEGLDNMPLILDKDGDWISVVPDGKDYIHLDKRPATVQWVCSSEELTAALQAIMKGK